MRSRNLFRICHSAKRENWLLIKEEMPEPRETRNVSANGLNALMKRYSEVQLATLVDTPPEGPQWLHEIKFDGYRLLGYVCDGASRLLTRNGKDWPSKFPSLLGALEKLPVKNAVLDMEAVTAR
jgi:bifunctional non-homologous end joining protein LigD